MYPHPHHPDQLLRLAQDRMDAAHSEAERARLAPPLRRRLAYALRAVAARLEPDLTLDHDQPAALNQI